MRFGIRGRQSWWQSTWQIALIFVFSASVIVVGIALFISTLSKADKLASIGWMTFSAFPLLIVVMIATFAKLQQTINLKSPQPRANKITSVDSEPSE